MWKCPNGGYVFENEEQTHVCAKSSVVDDYIATQPEEVRPLLQSIRRTIRMTAPEAIEKIAYRRPTFWQGENLIHFAAFKKHIGLYPGGRSLPRLRSGSRGIRHPREPFSSRLASRSITSSLLTLCAGD
ncbi:MAG: DUF1801 domain-containing protein [Sporolactobacillus sp.]